MKDITWVGLDVHKATTAFAIFRPGENQPLEGGMASNSEKIIRLLRKHGKGTEIRACYEAGPCGYELKREMEKAKIECVVVAPGLVPRRAGDRIKTDRRDAEKLARLYRAGELTSIRVPSEAEESVRDLCRCREDIKEDLTRHRHHLAQFLLRHGRIFPGKTAWSEAHWKWVRGNRFEDPNLTACLDSYVVQVEQAMERLKSLGLELDRVAKAEPWREGVERLVTLRGIKSLSALTLLAEIGDFRRFEHPRNLMGYIGLVPSEYSSGGTRRQGGITKTGNRHVRRVLVEAAWQYRHRPSVQGDLKKRSSAQPKWVRDESWKAQERLHRRYMRLVSRGKRSTVTVVAVARELAGFVWALMTKETSAA